MSSRGLEAFTFPAPPLACRALEIFWTNIGHAWRFPTLGYFSRVHQASSCIADPNTSYKKIEFERFLSDQGTGCDGIEEVLRGICKEADQKTDSGYS